MTLRWEEQENGDWHGMTGDIIVAMVVPSPGIRGKWLWDVTVHRPPGWRSSGHGTTALSARRSADRYWMRWLKSAALKPDLERLAAA